MIKFSSRTATSDLGNANAQALVEAASALAALPGNVDAAESEAILARFDERLLAERRDRYSTYFALSLAVGKRMVPGPAKATVEQVLAGRLTAMRQTTSRH